MERQKQKRCYLQCYNTETITLKYIPITYTIMSKTEFVLSTSLQSSGGRKQAVPTWSGTDGAEPELRATAARRTASYLATVEVGKGVSEKVSQIKE